MLPLQLAAIIHRALGNNQWNRLVNEQGYSLKCCQTEAYTNVRNHFFHKRNSELMLKGIWRRAVKWELHGTAKKLPLYE